MLKKDIDFIVGVRKVIEYFSVHVFEDITAEEERLALLYTANEILRGEKSGFDMRKHFRKLLKMNIPREVKSEVENFVQFFHGYF